MNQRSNSLSLFVLLPLLSIVLGGCVSKSVYQQQVDEAQRLRQDLSLQQQQAEQLKHDGEQLSEQLAACQSEREQQQIEHQAEQQRRHAIYHARELATQQEINAVHEQLSARREENRQLQTEQEQLRDEITELQRALERERIAREARLAAMSSTYNELVGNLEQELQRGELTISQLQDKLSVNLVEKILFASGTANLTEEGYRVLNQVGKALAKVSGKRIRVEGHTDNLRIKPSLQQTFPSNWELSAARAANVVRFLEDNAGIPGEKLEIAAFGPYQPVADNSTPEGRAENRRIQISLVTE
ncbi:MAG: OmpA family protein [Desulfuromonadaceae bacterium]|nr:OmpA family protein [Desulfuromonadaceae bacterium]